MRIDQWVPALHKGDAIGDSARLMRDAFRGWGHEADVYALELDDALEGDGRRFSEWKPGSKNDVVILHYALPSLLTQALQEHNSRRVLLHHNITPPEFFVGYDPEMVKICDLGRKQLRTLKESVDLALADSEFNRKELEEAGFENTGVLPIYVDFQRYNQPANPVLDKVLRDGRTNLLFVGRLAPNKKHDDLIKLASYWKRFISPDVRLILVGKLPKRREYFDALQALMYEEAFTPWEVVFTGHVDHDDLLAYYRTAHVFVSMSEHEGFGVPLIEAMLTRVPILAFKAAAVPDTMGDAGVQFTEKRMDEVAEMGKCLATDQQLRERILKGQDERLESFSPEAIQKTLKGYMDSL